MGRALTCAASNASRPCGVISTRCTRRSPGNGRRVTRPLASRSSTTRTMDALSLPTAATRALWLITPLAFSAIRTAKCRTGQERGFFLIPALVPFAVIAICAASIAARRPLTGVLLNRVSGGPARWREIDQLRRVYTVTTLAAAAVNAVNAAVQAVFYLANDPVVLAAAHIATGPVFAVIVAVTIVLARRVMPANPALPANPARPATQLGE
jgi:hypothetical protein